MHVTYSLAVGGSEIFALTVASHLDPRKFRSTLCALDLGGALEEEAHRLGIPHVVLYRRPGITLGLIGKLYQLFRRSRVDVVHTHHFNQFLYSVIGARLLGARVIYTEHCVEAFEKRSVRIATRLLSRLCYKVVAIGSEVARVLEEEVGVPAHKLEVIRAGIDVAAFNQPRAEARRTLGLQDTDRIAVTVARLAPEKNQRLLVGAFADVVKRFPAARLLIAGEGSEEAAIRAEVARLGLTQRVELLGRRRDIPRILAAADVFVLSSDHEGLPLAVLEAMAAARPVVATRIGELSAVVRDGETGRLVQPRDREALATALAEMLNDPRLASEMGARARQLVQGHYSLRAMIENHEALYTAP
jgi:glycosyltransferase involved in cell wall biosynthesis